MEGKEKIIELRTAEGNLIFTLHVIEKEKADGKGITDEFLDPAPRSDDSSMTEAQKRYLFRLLAERGIEGDEALKRLKQLFQVDSLKEVTKVEASKMIDQLLSEKGGGEDA